MVVHIPRKTVQNLHQEIEKDPIKSNNNMNNKEILQAFWQCFYLFFLILLIKKKEWKKEKLIWDMFKKLIN